MIEVRCASLSCPRPDELILRPEHVSMVESGNDGFTRLLYALDTMSVYHPECCDDPACTSPHPRSA